MKKTYFFIIILLSIFVSLKTYSQRKDILDVVANAKIFFFNGDTSFYTAKQINNILNDSSNYEILTSKGFSNELIFINLKFRTSFKSLRKKEINDSLYIKNTVPFSCDYILGYNWSKNKFYRLKGFLSNDFTLIFKKKFATKDKVFFLNQFWIDQLDMACLFDSFFGKQKGNGSSPCIQACSLGDPKILKVRND